MQEVGGARREFLKTLVEYRGGRTVSFLSEDFLRHTYIWIDVNVWFCVAPVLLVRAVSLFLVWGEQKRTCAWSLGLCLMLCRKLVFA